MYINVYFSVVNSLMKIYFFKKVIMLLFPDWHFITLHMYISYQHIATTPTELVTNNSHLYRYFKEITSRTHQQICTTICSRLVWSDLAYRFLLIFKPTRSKTFSCCEECPGSGAEMEHILFILLVVLLVAGIDKLSQISDIICWIFLFLTFFPVLQKHRGIWNCFET